MKTTQFMVTLWLLVLTLSLGSGVYAQSSETLMRMGVQLLKNGAYDQAVTKFKKILSRNPHDFEAQYNLGLVYLEWGKNSSAIREFNKAVSLNSQSAIVWSNLALAYENLGQSKNATSALYQAVASDPHNIQARINLASTYAKKGLTNEAIEQYTLAIQIDGSNVDALVNLARCFKVLNRQKEAKHYLQRAIMHNPNNPLPYYEIGNILWKNDNKVEEAMKNYRKAIVIQPNSQIFYENFGLLLEDQWKKNKDDTKRVEAIGVWEKSLVYLDDIWKKENIKDRLSKLQQGEMPSGKAKAEDLFGTDNAQKEKFEALRKEMRKGDNEQKNSAYQKIAVDKYDVSSDLADLEDDTTQAFDFIIDKSRLKSQKSKKE